MVDGESNLPNHLRSLVCSFLRRFLVLWYHGSLKKNPPPLFDLPSLVPSLISHTAIKRGGNIGIVLAMILGPTRCSGLSYRSSEVQPLVLNYNVWRHFYKTKSWNDISQSERYQRGTGTRDIFKKPNHVSPLVMSIHMYQYYVSFSFLVRNKKRTPPPPSGTASPYPYA